MTEVAREYKDRLFTFIFGREENREWTLSLYNAINQSSYANPDAIEFTTIKEMLYLGMHNDVSFIIANELNLYEQQATYNPNMPLRQMQYAGNLFEQYIVKHDKNKFGKTLIKLPVPKLVVFYNGTDDQPQEKILRLSDAFPKGAKADIAVRVRMINVNEGKIPMLFKACQPLREYAWIVDKIRKYAHNMEPDDAVAKAIRDIPENFVLKKFLMIHQAEVLGMLLTEYNEAEVMELFKEDGRKEGIEEGIEKGIEEGRDKLLISLVHKKLERGKQPQTIADEVEEPLETVDEIIKAIESLGDDDYDDQKVLEAWKMTADKL